MSRISGIIAGSYLSSFLQNTLKTNQVEINTDSRTLRPVAKLKEPRDLFASPKESGCPQGAARWPAECQVLEERVQHIDPPVLAPEKYYQPTGCEMQPKPVGEEAGQVVFQYYPISAVSYFSRSSVGGSKYFLDSCPCGDRVEGLRFESRFESGNLAKVVKITESYYELYLRTDMYTNRHIQWYYFRVENTKSHMLYRFSLVNMCKAESLYSVGMRPLLYSTKDAQLKGIGWRRCGDNITYYRNEPLPGEEDQLPSYTLTFNIEFPHDDDQVYLAHCYPYTYTDLQDYLVQLQNHPVKSTYSKLRPLCRSLAGNNVYYLTVTAPSLQDESKKKKAVVVTARVHPGETPASWMMKGFMDFLTGDSLQARELRGKFIFKLVPMLNPDGVIVGNNRCSLTGRDLNRQYRTVIRETYPPIWNTKLMIRRLYRRLMEDCGIEMYCDLHAHSRKHNIFIYGCENRRSADRRLQEQVFPLMLHKNAADKFSFESCKFRIQRCKEGTGRVVVWMMGVANSYTMEASFGGSVLGGRAGTHFTTQDYEQMGRHFCETLLDFCDQDPSKERLRCKIINRLVQEGSSADDPTNINLSDYSSDVGDTSSLSEEEGAGMGIVPRTEGCCLPLRVPPSSPVLPRRENHKTDLPPDNKPEHASVAPAASDWSPAPQRTRPTLLIHRTTIDLGTDPGSDLNDPATDSEDDSSYRHHRSQSCEKADISPGRVSTNKCIVSSDMPPELIVTSAQGQVISVDSYEKQADGAATSGLQQKHMEKTRHRSSQMSVGVNRACKMAIPQLGTEIRWTRQSSLLRKKIWTSIPCTCHEPNAPTHWSGHGGEASTLQACSRKLSNLQKQKRDPVERSRKPNKKQGEDCRLLRASVSDISAGEETKRNAIMKEIRTSSRKHLHHDDIRKVHKGSSNDTSPGEDMENNLADVKKLLRQKCKLQKWKTSSSSEYMCETVGKTESLHQQKKPHKFEPSPHAHQRKVCKKPSLKWKFCHAVASVVTTHDSNARNLVDLTGSTSESSTEDNKLEIPAVRASSAHSKKKKRHKSTAGHKKSRHVSSASSVLSTSRKQTSSKKLVKT
ncbi:cytosolic carboxypeptidase 2-like isoform X3 [Zootermopsis nevadensis]|uniref:cytosolic carboxypeptidase 2-like isoform X3 n=1 Tax=Zootermopsis nevadensis TaxID=136037 RepID=UPI000B8E7C31|nr:cytosolic carboxypeptidase 2-like isoform X3 [Zootermopsis nevadensis]